MPLIRRKLKRLDLKTLLKGASEANQRLAETVQKARFSASIPGLDYVTIKGDKGDKGDAGHSPNEDEIVRRVMGRIRLPKDGKNGRDGVDGITPDTESIVRKAVRAVMSRIDIPKDAYTPKKGIDYFDGIDGSPDTPEQILEKVNKAKELIKRNRVEGLNEQIEILQKQIREMARVRHGGGVGGGGSANWIRETPVGTINGSNVTFTITSNIIPNSETLYLGGIGLTPTTDYSISGRTITYVTAPPTNNTHSIKYQRR